MKKVKIRVFGSSDCQTCQNLAESYEHNKISYVFVDALADDTQDLCDRHGVDELPHVQIIALNGKVVFNKSGFVPAGEIKAFLQK